MSHSHIVLSTASVKATAPAMLEGCHQLGFQALADDHVPRAEIVPCEVSQATVQNDTGPAQVKQHRVDLRIELSGISVVLIISEVEVREPSIVTNTTASRNELPSSSFFEMLGTRSRRISISEALRKSSHLGVQSVREAVILAQNYWRARNFPLPK
jgi:hypothetical protein